MHISLAYRKYTKRFAERKYSFYKQQIGLSESERHVSVYVTSILAKALILFNNVTQT